MSTLTIKDVPPEFYARLKKAVEGSGMSMRGFVLSAIARQMLYDWKQQVGPEVRERIERFERLEIQEEEIGG